MEPTTGIEPVNLFLTKEVLYLLSYVGKRESSQQNWRGFVVYGNLDSWVIEKSKLLIASRVPIC
jgi:hypothetical protein